MVIGTAYVVFVADDFIGPFQGFLITLGVPIAAWCGVILADVAAAPARLRRRRALPTHRPVRRRPAGADRAGRARHRARLGPGHQHLRGLARLAGLPARPARARRPGRAPGRTRTSACWPRWRSASSATCSPRAAGCGTRSRRPPPGTRRRRPGDPGTGDPRGGAWLVVIDMQAVFADPGSGWAVPRFAAAAAGVDRLRPAFAEADPAHPLRRTGRAGRGLAGLLRAVAVGTAAGRLAAVGAGRRPGRAGPGPADVRQVGPGAGRRPPARPGPGAGRRGHLTAACCPPRWPRPTPASGSGWSRTPAPAAPTPTTSGRCWRWRSTRRWSP